MEDIWDTILSEYTEIVFSNYFAMEDVYCGGDEEERE